VIANGLGFATATAYCAYHVTTIRGCARLDRMAPPLPFSFFGSSLLGGAGGLSGWQGRLESGSFYWNNCLYRVMCVELGIFLPA